MSLWRDFTEWERRHVAEFAVAETSAGPPIPAFTTIAAEAESWTAFASLHELKVYAKTVFLKSPAEVQKSFSAWTARRCR